MRSHIFKDQNNSATKYDMKIIIVPHTHYARCLLAQYCVGLNVVFFKYLDFEKLLYYQNNLKIVDFGPRL